MATLFLERFYARSQGSMAMLPEYAGGHVISYPIVSNDSEALPGAKTRHVGPVIPGRQ